jgi:tetratricopeptide (TPR) repeat protein
MKYAFSFFCIAAFLCVLIPGAARAQECAKLIEQGKQHFAQYDQGQKEFDEAQAAYLEAAKTPGCAYEAYWRLADLHLCWGTVQKGKDAKVAVFKKGVAYAEQAVAANPNGVEGHYQYTVNQGSIIDVEGVLKNIGKVKKIKRSNDKALSINPNYAPALTVDGRFDIDMPGLFGGSNKKGEEKLRKAISAMPNFETAYTELAAFLIKEKRYDEARQILGKLMAPDFKHEFKAPWLTIDKPKAESLLKQIDAAGASGKK